MSQRTELTAEEPRERVAVTMGLKVNLGNYESADASICLSGVPVGASDALIEEMLDTSKVVFGKLKGRLLSQVNALREEVKRGGA